jgi:formyltetrahydrofolate deformylase
MNTYVLLIACPDQKGLIHNVTGILYDHNLNIISNGEFVEKETDRFFMRTEFAGDISVNGLTSTLREVLPATAFVIVMATRESHCLGDLLIRHYSQSLPVVIRAVVSNYDHLRELTEKFHIDYHHVSHENCSREEHEARIGAIIDQYSPDYLVLAKYMRILSPSLIRKFENRIVNIHHSFLPAFVGARPYEKAYARGVKIIGATAHFVNEDLDEGPIIAQNVIPVSHSHSARDMAQAGKDVEKIVLAKALKLVAEDRVFVSGNKTIIFD